MRKRLSLSLMLVLVCVAAAHGDDSVQPAVHPDSSAWQNLFAPDLSNAIYPAGIWSFQDGILTATEDQNIWTKEEYENCIIDLEFNNGPAANSGLFVYGSDLANSTPNSIEVQILDDYHEAWAKVPTTWHCGGIFGRLAPTKSIVKPAGQWNRMTVTCLGPMIYVLLNGEQTAEFDMRKWTTVNKNPDGSDIPPWLSKPAAELPTKGHVSLQGKHGGAPIYFRNVKIKSLSP